MWHSLDENGKIEIYDVEWPDGTIETNVPVELLESIEEGSHNEGQEHGVQDKNTPVSERSYKDRTMKIKLSELKKIIQEECGITNLASDATDHMSGRDLGYGEGEGKMTRSQLDKLARYAQHLHDTLRDSDDLPEWVQSKIAIAAHDIGRVKHYLEYKLKSMKESKAFGGDEPDYMNISQETAKKKLDTIKKKYGKNWDDMLKAFQWAENPEAALATLHKKAYGKWPREE